MRFVCCLSQAEPGGAFPEEHGDAAAYRHILRGEGVGGDVADGHERGLDHALLLPTAKGATEAGGALYGKRQGMIEPVFGDAKFNRRMDRFLRRGRAACRSEWRLINATGNLLKLHRHQIATTAA